LHEGNLTEFFAAMTSNVRVLNIPVAKLPEKDGHAGAARQLVLI
jgi:hypothetical protein